MPPRALARVPPAAALAAVLLGAPARADEKEWVLSLDPAASLIHVGDASGWGGGGGLDLTYGVTDALALRVTGAATGHVLGPTMTEPGDTLLAYYAGAGLSYAIDVIRLVPYVDVSLGLLGHAREINGAWQTTNNVGLEIGLGADYAINRRVSVGVVVRYFAVLQQVSSIPIYLYFGPRLAFHFGG